MSTLSGLSELTTLIVSELNVYISFLSSGFIRFGCVGLLWFRTNHHSFDCLRFGVSQQPIYINLIRKPLDRLVSYYYFVRYGDDLHPYHIRRRMGDKMVSSHCFLCTSAACAVLMF